MKEKEKLQVSKVGLETTKPYLEGVEAFKNNTPSENNPYPSGSQNGHMGMNDDRYRWFMGWYDIKLKKLLDDKEATKDPQP